MAGPSVMVRVLGDVSGLAKSFASTGDNARGAATSATAAFGTMLSTLNKTGVLGPFGEALAQVDETMAGIAEHGKKASDVLVGAGAGLVGVGVGLSVLGSKEQAAQQQLETAISATGHSYDEYGKAIDEAIKHQERFGNSSVQTQQALQILTQATHDPAKALQLLNETSDLAAAKHESLAEAATSLGKVYNGNTKLLKEYGITVDKHTHLTKDGQTATQALAGVLKGQASAAADTFNGHIKAITTSIEDQTAKFGEKYGPALQGAGAALTGLGTAMKLVQAAREAMTGATEAGVVADDALTASEVTAEAAGLPLIATVGLVALAVAALGVAAYELYTHWTTVWRVMKEAAADVWNWIQKYWPYLAGILLGPIGLAAAVIYRHWHDIQAGAEAVWNWIKTHWPLLVDILLGPFGIAATQIYEHWHQIVDFFTGLPKTLESVLSSVASILVAPFKAAFDAIADVWNNTVGSLSFKVPSWVPFLGGDGFSMPKIPHLAQGGLITQTGLVFAHAGEAITPIDKVPRGPAVHIQNATFTSEMDVEKFMRQVAWTVQTQAI